MNRNTSEKREKRLRDTYDYIKRSTADRGYPPCVKDICRNVGTKSTNTAHNDLRELELRGLISCEKHRTRAIRIIKEWDPKDAHPLPFGENKQYICDLLLPALQATRQLSELIDLEYDADKEIIKATFDIGSTRTIDVTGDSGTAMIKDILRKIV